ncbi:DMT family transporter [Candidatus Micrarchaeota archaeon]|nr:DMT family transporter [Candidatus Micrarchaeota archaeon]
MKKGFSFALLTALISGISVFINSFGVSLGDPFVYTTVKNSLVAVFLLSCIFLLGKLKELSLLSSKQRADLAIIGIIGGAIPFLLFFYGLSIGNAGSTSFIYRSLFIVSAILGTFWLKENFDFRYVLGAIIIFLGNLLLLKDIFVFGLGEFFVLLATLFWAIEYAYSRKTLESISPMTLAFGRMAIGSVVLLGFIALTGKFDQLVSAKPESYAWALVSSLFLFAFVLSWYTTLKYTSLSKASAIFVLGGPITALLQLIFANKVFSFNEVIGLLLIVTGVALVIGISDLLTTIVRLPTLMPDQAKLKFRESHERD